MSTPNPSTANQPTLLTIDTSSAHLSLGVHHHGRSHCVYEAVGNRQSALILPTLHTLLALCADWTLWANLTLRALQALRALGALRAGRTLRTSVTHQTNRALNTLWPCRASLTL